MSTRHFSTLFGATLLAATLLLPGRAQARFGKTDDDSRSEVHRASPARHGGSHVVVEEDHGSWFAALVGAFFGHHHHHDSYVYVEPAPVVVAPPPVYMAPPPPYYAPPPPPTVTAESSTGRGGFGLGLTAQAHGEGATLGVGLFLEGRRLGFNLGADGIYARSEDYRLTVDTIRLANAHLTWAFVANDVLRLRLEGGVSAAIGEDLAAVGPDVGISGRLNIIGPLGVEAASHLTLTPFGRWDSRAAVTLAIGVVQLQGGWRETFLDDRGLVGQRHVDRFGGPFAGIGLVF